MTADAALALLTGERELVHLAHRFLHNSPLRLCLE